MRICSQNKYKISK